MEIEGVYEYEGKDYTILLSQNGWERNDFISEENLASKRIENYDVESLTSSKLTQIYL